MAVQESEIFNFAEAPTRIEIFESSIPVSKFKDLLVCFVINELNFQTDAQRQVQDHIADMLNDPNYRRSPFEAYNKEREKKRSERFEGMVLGTYDYYDEVIRIVEKRISAIEHFTNLIESKTGLQVGFKSLRRLAERRVEDQESLNT